LLASLHTDLNVVSQHQDDLAEGVSYLGSALKGFQSIAYSGSTPVPWGNIFVNPASLTQGFGIIGPCGTLDQVLNQVLGPDPAACDQQTGPLPGTGSNAEPGGGPNVPSGSSTTSTTGAGSSSSTKPSSSNAGGPNSGVGGLSQLLNPLLQGTKK
jgi:hypothetical protein